MPAMRPGGAEDKARGRTYWDPAIANLQVLEPLKIPQAFVLGTRKADA